MSNKSGKDYQKILIFDNHFQAELTKKALTDAQIPFYVHCNHDTAYNGLFQFQKGWGYLKAPAEYHDQIVEIFENIKSVKN